MHIKEIAIEMAQKAYNPDFFESIDEEKKVTLGMSKLLSKACDFDGSLILEACIEALTDANFHKEADKVQRILSNLGGN